MEIDTYNFAALVYEELRRRRWPLQTNLSVYQAWEWLTEADQRLWEDAVERALVRSGVVPGDAQPGGYCIHRPRQFREPKEGET